MLNAWEFCKGKNRIGMKTKMWTVECKMPGPLLCPVALSKVLQSV